MIAQVVHNTAKTAQLERKAELLSGRGWKFRRLTGPNGVYYRGRGPRAMRIQSEADPDERVALKNAIEHAFRYWNG